MRNGTLKHTILIVEDENLIALDTAMLLEDHDFKTIIASTGEEALEKVRENPAIDLILMDIDLGPGIDGPETARRILKNKTIPIVFLTSHAEEDMVEKVRSITRYGYVIKNSGDFVLLSSIEMAFELHEAHTTLQNQLKALEESEKKHEIFLDAINDLAYLKDDQFRYILINDANARFFGKTKEEIIGKTDFDLMSLNHARHCRKTDQKSLQENQIVISEEAINNRIYETRKFPVPLTREKKGVGAYIRDITGQTRMENTLKESEEKFRNLAESTPFAIMIYQDNKWVYTNPAGEKISGYSKEELFRMKFWEVVDPEYRDLIISRGQKRQTGQETENSYEFQIRNKTGERRWVYLNGRSITYRGKPAGLISITDITDRKKAEEALRLSEKTHKDIINSISEAIFIQKPDGTIIDINDTAIHMYGYSKEEIIGNTQKFLSAPGKNDMEKIFRLIHSAAKGKRERLEFWARRKDGTLFPKEVSLSPGSYFGKDVVIAVAWDITERVRQESILRESKSRYKALFTNNHSVMLLVDPETGNIQNANPAASRFYGWDIETLRTMNISDINLRTKDENKKAFILAKTEQQQHFFFTHRLANGELRDVEIHSGPIDIGGKHLLYSIIHDITDRKKAEKALRDREEYLSITLQSIGDAVIATDVDGRITRMNRVAEKLTGWSFQDAQGLPLTSVFRIINALTRLNVTDPVAMVLKTGKTTELANHTILMAKEGTEYHISDSAAPIIDHSGRIQGVILVFSNITEKYRNQQKIQESERMLNTLISNLPGMVYRCKNVPDWPMEFVSPGSVKLTGYEPKDFYVNHNLYKNIIHPEDRQRVWDTIQKAIDEEKPFNLHYRLKDRYGNEKWVREQGQAILCDTEEILHLEGFISDITPQKKANLKIEKLLEEKELLLRELHHRTKNNMNTMSSLLSLQHKQIKNDEAALALKDAQNRLKTMMNIYDKLYRSQDYRNISSYTYLHELINNISSAFIERPKIRISQEVEDISLDSNLLFSLGLILNEMLTNSYKYAFPENTEGLISIHFSYHKKTNFLIFKYCDNGVGIPNEVITDKRSGLGLNLIHLLADQVGGKLTLSGKNGTVCTVIIPFNTP